jgi:hypothetical protein
MSGPSYSSALNVKSSIISSNINWEIGLEKFLRFMPVDLSLEIDSCCLSVQAKRLFDGTQTRVQSICELNPYS